MAEPMGLEIDHVLIAVADLAGGAAEFEQRYRLASLEGGRHPGWGTANRIVPLGSAYLELIAVVDPREAADSVFGGWILNGKPGRPIGWAVRTTDLAAVAARLGLGIIHGSRRTPAGDTLRWRSAGSEESSRNPSLPFFIEWERGTPHPGSPARQPARIVGIELIGDAKQLREWLGMAELPVQVAAGPPSLQRIRLQRNGEDITIPA
jgi:Glyoxalase-like domain